MNPEKFYLLRAPLSKLWAWLRLLAVYVLLIGVFYVGTRVSLEWSQNHLPLGLHLLVIGFWALVSLIWVRIISGELGKKRFIDSYVDGILWPPFVYSISLLLMAASVFASISVTLQRCGYAKFEPPLPNDLSPVVDFYMWHFVNLIPGLGIPETLRWTQPYQYSDHLSGLVLLIFKIAVILPVIASFKLWHDVRKTAVAEKKWSALEDGMSPREVANLLGESGLKSGTDAVATIWRYTFDKDSPDRELIFNQSVTPQDTKGKLIDWTNKKKRAF